MKFFYTHCLLWLLLAGIYLGCSGEKSHVTVAKPSTPDSIDYSFKMGVNLNEQVDVADMQDIADSKTKWVRCFIEVIDLYKAGTINTDAKIAAYNSLKSKGYKTVLSLKFNFLKNGFPAKDGQDWNNYLSFISTLLAKVMPYTDVLIVGNEPFIEAAPATWNEPLNSFYKEATDKVHTYFEQNNIEKPIFLGAFDNMYQTTQQTNAGYLNLLAFAKATSYLAGIDLHIHHNSEAEMTSALNFAASKIRADQKMLVTEFSLMKYWRSYNDSAIAPAFIKAAEASASDSIELPPSSVTKNYQYIDYALKNPRPAQEWYAFWANSPYLAAKSSYLCTAYQSFLATGNVYLSFYALRQSYPDNTDFTVSTDPWVLNGLFLNRSVQQVNGRNQKSYSFLDQFQKIAENENPCQ
ncbi:hypothetical protein SAMN05192529_10753 [Arachidicoccus rhizosphaerae]|jgi:hypothetical protein|uniref:Uncharacterized protein n=1 Tax=Arachidicoccus rhizosphaerae TaxID=551991 RepID=A0A1H3Y3Z4_9BACT|nr:hypothetical protein [Arachidicoccus rhizosphaerae]SEA05538.1 hypothetical protein SAMN05192529_10753 [Arachidicoccus rhizosphaerae]